MSFQAYLDAVERIAKKSIKDIHQKMITDGLLENNLKAQTFVEYLNQTYGIGKGHAMALWKYAVEHTWFETKHTTLK
jgi:hypothetical protein